MTKFLLVLLYVFLNPMLNEDTVISWSETKKLTWSDFKAVTPSKTDDVALTASGISFSFSVKEQNDEFVSFNTSVEAHFYPEKSWFINGRANDYILAHEQLHFDITELHARKLRCEISKLKISPTIKQELRFLNQKANKDMAEMQNQYDAKTDHSRQSEQQRDWNKWIHSEIHKLKDFGSK